MRPHRQGSTGTVSQPPDCSLDTLERAWLLAHSEAQALAEECRLLEQVVLSVHADWRCKRERLEQSKALRDALGEECSRQQLAEENAGTLAPARSVA